MSSCPPFSVLVLIARGMLDPDAKARLDHDVDRCPECRSVLEQIDATASSPGVESGEAVETDGEFPELDGFVVEGVLGRGGMAVVYRARTTDFNRPVALKVLRRGPEGGARDQRRWNREARALSLIPAHPNVVQFHGAGFQKELRYLVLELVEGGTLKDRLERPIPARQAAALLLPLAKAVQHLHQAGVHHLDIKPANILLQGPSHGDWTEVVPRLADFGISKLESKESGEALTTIAGPRGTPEYMAPEQVKGNMDDIGRPADVYGLGATLYHLLTGRPPFPPATTIMMQAMVIDQNPVAPRSLVPSIPRDLETICLTCLQKKPEARYDSAQALADDLSRWLDGYPILAKPVSPVRKVWSWCCRRPVIAGLLSAVILLVLVSTIGFYTLWRRAETALALAEANYDETAKSLDGLISHTLTTYDTNLPPGPFTALLETARGRELALRRMKPDDEAGRQRLAQIDRLLANAYYVGGPLRKAQTLFLEYNTLIDESIAQSGGSDTVRLEQLGVLEMLGELGAEFPEPSTSEEFLDWWCRKVEMLANSFKSREVLISAHLGLSNYRRRMADRLSRHGKVGLARWLVEHDLSIINSTLQEIGATPGLVISGLLDRIRLGEAEDIHRLRELLDSTRQSINSESKLFDQSIAGYIAVVTATTIGWLPTHGPATTPPRTFADHAPEEWASRVLSEIEARAREAKLASNAPMRIIESFVEIASIRLTTQRMLGQFDDAARDADRYLALGNRCVESYPRSSEARILLSEAYVQKAKNASRTDHAQSVDFMAKALDAARTAVSLAPEDYTARRNLDARNAQYERYRTNK